MSPALKITVWAVAGLFVLAALWAVALAVGRQRWAAQTQALRQQLDAARRPLPALRFDPAELDGLPPPVARWLRRSLPAGAALPAALEIDTEGLFNASETAERWQPFHAQQRVTLQRPGFVWHARLPMAAGLSVHVHDAYVAGQGLLHAALGGLLTVAEARGGAFDEGELMRYLAEAAWYPAALLPSQGVRWAPVDDRHARATLSDGAATVTLTYAFDEQGRMVGCRAEARGRSVGGRVEPTPWEGRWFDHAPRDGVEVPLRGEVAWVLPDGPRPYWRGRVTALRTEPAR